MVYQFLNAKKVQEYTQGNNSFFRGFLYYEERFYKGNIDDILNKIKTEEEFIEKLRHFNGNFCLIFNLNDKTYLVADRIMSFPLFYSKRGENIYVSDSIDQITSQLNINSINKYAAKEFLASGFVLSDSTVFNGINFVLAGTCVVVDNQTGKTYIERYFNHEHGNYLEGDMDKLSLMLEKVTDNVFKRMIEGLNGRQVVLFLSGGYDSRLVAVMLHKHNYKNVICFSFKTRKGKEENVAREIAEDLGFKWILLDAVEIYHKITKEDDFKKYMFEAAGGITLPYFQGCLIKDYIKNGILEKDCIAITGNSGDVIEGNDFSSILKEKRNYTKNDVIDAIIDTYCCQYGIKYGHQKYIRRLVEKSIPHKEQYSYAEAQDVYEIYNWQHRQTKYVVNDIRCYDIYLGIEWRLPLWDNELVDFWLRIPAEVRENRKLYYYYVRKESYNTANVESFYGKIREYIRSNAHFILRIFYPYRKIYEYEMEKRWTYYGVNLREYLKILKINGGYKTNSFTTRIFKFYDTYYRPLIKSQEIL